MWSRSKTLANLPLRQKLVLSGLLPSVLVLLLAAAVFVGYDLLSFVTTARRALAGQAQFIALATRAAIQFQSYDYASVVLSGLESDPEITAAAIYAPSGEILVEYFPNDRKVPLPKLDDGKLELPRTPQGKIWVSQPITLNGETIGLVFIEAGFRRFWDRATILLGGALGALLLLTLLAYVLSTRLQRHIATPLTQLTTAARAVSLRQDYSVRVDEQPGPEFHVLTQAFNQMLGQIQAQDAELRSRAAALEAANAELESFSYSVAHDLRSPLRALSGFSHLISAKYATTLPEDASDYLSRIRAGAERMAALIDDLLALSHLEREPLRRTTVQPAAIAKEALEELHSMLNGRQVELAIDVIPPAEADPALLRQVYVNLLSNALKYSRNRDPARVRVGALQENGTPVYFVRDNGVGFEMRHATKLFRVFQRLHSSEQFEGTGVGLAIVQRIIHRHGGKIWPESEPDKGTTFYFTLNQEQKN